jgi:hypothetical protein
MVPIKHFCCQNPPCPDAGARGGGNLYFRGFSGKGRRIRPVYGRTCKRPSSERKGTVLEDARLPDDKALAILKPIQEGCGTRATSRLVEDDKDTVTRYLAQAGARAEEPHDELVALPPPPVRSRSMRSGGSSSRRKRRAIRSIPWIGPGATTGNTPPSIPRAGGPWPWCRASATARPASG